MAATQYYVTSSGEIVGAAGVAPSDGERWWGPYGAGQARDVAKAVIAGRLAPDRQVQRDRQAQRAGAQAAPAPAQVAPPRTKPAVHDGMAIASLVLGIVWLSGLGSILAVIFGHVHLNAAKKDGRQNSGMAVTGLVLGYIGIAGAIVIVALFIAAAVATSHAATSICYPNC
jgi:hypothetical protein